MIVYRNVCLDNIEENLYKTISKDLEEKKYIISSESLLENILEREKKGSLYIGNGISLPHLKSNNILINSIHIYVLNNKKNNIDTVIVILLNDSVEKIELKEVVNFVLSLDKQEVLLKIRRGEYGNQEYN